MKNQMNNPYTLEAINNATREELIFNTVVGSLISFNNYRTFNFRKAIFQILQNDELTQEVYETMDLDIDMLETLMCAQISPATEEITKAIGDRLEATMPQPAW